MERYTIFLLVMRLSMSLILKTFTNILWKNTILYNVYIHWANAYCSDTDPTVLVVHWLENFYSWTINHAWSAPFDLNPDELYYYPFIISIIRCNGSCDTFKDQFGKVWMSIKMADVNLKLFNMIKGVNESKTIKNIPHASVDGDLMVENITQKCSTKIEQW